VSPLRGRRLEAEPPRPCRQSSGRRLRPRTFLRFGDSGHRLARNTPRWAGVAHRRRVPRMSRDV
jgi:hypothetical protein